MKRAFRVLLLAICFSLVYMSLPQWALADRGMVPLSDVSVYGPGQKAIIAWNDGEEILILSTDVSASSDSQVLEILPLPSEPKVEKGDFASFEQVDKLIERHFPSGWWDGFRKGMLIPGEGVEIIFHEKIGAHDITVVKVADSTELVQWAEEFLKQAGIEYEISSPKLESLVGDYIARDINYFVFDLIEVTSEPKSIEPIVYRFDSDFLYYPLKISTLAEGWTDINLFLLTPQPVNLHLLPWGSELPQGLEMGNFYGKYGVRPIQFKLTGEELASIDKDIAGLLEGDTWLTAMSYHGDLAGLTGDLMIGWISPNPKFAFDCYQGRCASGEKSHAIIGAFDNTIVAYGVAITPTPCYELEARLDIPPAFAYPRTIIVDIIAKEKPGFCIECLGEVPFRAKIADLIPGLYDIIVQYQGKVIGQEEVFLPLSSIAEYFELPYQATLKVGILEGRFRVYIENKFDIEVLDSDVVVGAKLSGSDMKLHTAYLQFNEISTEAMVEVDNVPVIIKISPSCELKIQDSQLFLDTNYCLLPVWVMPDQAASNLQVESYHIELKVIEDKAVYEIQGVTHKNLLGLVSKEVSIKAQVDAATGEIIQQQKPWWANLCW